MGRLRTAEVRRLLRYLSERVEDPEGLAEIEDALRDEDAEEFLREPDLITYFPEQTVEIAAAGAKWQLRIIPHALLRMVQRGISQAGEQFYVNYFDQERRTKGDNPTLGLILCTDKNDAV